eukprot:CAMPEP_0169462648 /NCGR_PEP_ID=MMETSP1042-20121227/19678_1 /TAXON_ID=464988 /ORGANISM="Hemiselmis andersenii, Strain CCMP1180" /LENGTH=75 /DNA_ID=CAMNT_0009575311 /DNA_START=65 /DNA_END=289 /DNA_ORIENTATION=+
MESSSPDTPTQLHNAEMRRKMLMFWEAAISRPVSMECHGGTRVSGVFAGTDGSQEVMLVEQLATPLGVYPAAMVR